MGIQPERGRETSLAETSHPDRIVTTRLIKPTLIRAPRGAQKAVR
jgi:hypothetical protein